MSGLKLKRAGRIIIYLTAAVMLAVLMPSLDTEELTGSAVSLKHIEEIVAQSGEFHILEIVPDAGAASIGYYIDGQEPVAGWKTALAGISTPEARRGYVNALFDRLADKGVMSDTETTPLRRTYYDEAGGDYYTEAYLPGDVQNWSVLNLNNTETVTLTGTMTPQEDGPFRASYDYTPSPGGGYIQNIKYFSWTVAPVHGASYYYYDPLFLPITPATNLSSMLDMTVYELDSSGRYYTQTYTDEHGVLQPYTVQVYINSGGFDMSDFDFDDPETFRYFYVDPMLIGEPGASASHRYMAISDYADADDAPGDGFTDAPDEFASYFARTADSYVYVIEGGNFAYSDEGADEYTVHFNSVYYKGGFVSNNLFKRQVFGLDTSDLNALGVTVAVREAGSVTEADIAAADLIYLSSGTDITTDGAVLTYDGVDLPADKAARIYDYAAGQYPVIIDYRIVEGITQDTPPEDISAIEKLALLCLHPVLTPADGTSFDDLTVNWQQLAYLTGDTDKTLVNNNVYCFDAFNTEALGGAPNVSALVTPSFELPFSETVCSEGFSAVLEEIINENFLHQLAEETELMPEVVSVSASVRHIINFQGRRQLNAKTAIKVLDLQPAKVTSNTWLTNEDVLGWLPPLMEGEVYPEITIVHMTTGEFIGKIDDMVETYDMIYIGMSVESFNKDAAGNTLYNDPGMNGLVYSDVGDIFRGSLELSGIRDQDYVTVSGVSAIDGAPGTNADKFRFSGNDITASKVIEFEKFAQAGYPIILGEGFIEDGAVNTEKIDCRSYMYQAIRRLYGAYPNVMSEQSAALDRELVKKHLNVSKPSLELTGMPPEYVDSSSPTLTAGSDSYYYLTFRFSISNVTDPTPISTTYDCRLLIDFNADGRYSDNEELGDIEVRRASDDTLVLPLMDASGSEFYALSAGVAYSVTRQMPEGYVGIIPWKLEVIKNEAAQIHASAQGFTRIAAGGNYETIRVLQIMQDGTAGSRLNLASQLTVNPSGSNPQLRGDDGKYYTGIYGKLIADLDDFRVLIDVIETDDLENKRTVPAPPASSDNIFNYLNDYDMLIIGFNDCFDGIGAYSADAVVKFIESGKSVLFTHDTTSLTQTAPNPAHPGAYPLATPPSVAKTLSDHSVIWNSATREYKSVNGNVSWYGNYSTTVPPYLKQTDPTYIVFLASSVSSNNENDYFNAKAGTSGDYAIYEINDISSFGDVDAAQIKNVTSGTTLQAFRNAHPGAEIVYVRVTNYSGWYGRTETNKYNVSLTGTFTKFVGGARYVCSGLQYSASNGSTSSRRDLNSGSYEYFALCLARDSSPDSYTVAGTFNGVNRYTIGGQTYYQSALLPFPQKKLYSADPDTTRTLTWQPGSIIDWGYYFNTIIRDYVGLDRYGVTNPQLQSIVDKSDSMNAAEIAYVLSNNRSVAFLPKSTDDDIRTVPEFQGYTNYALIRFAGSGNTYRYTNNNYSNRETTNVSQVNKGQITSYPYNVNTASFGGTDSGITKYGGSYMKIGKTHEQYFQINMNTDDIVVWYCMSNYSGINNGVITYDNNSYYDDVPNDCVNAYYIYNKGNVTYSGVGHTSGTGYYTGSNIAEEYINEAKLFVNTMIAAYQSAAQDPTLSIKQDARGTSDLREKYLLINPESNPADTFVLASRLGPTDDSRAVHYRLTDPNVGEGKIITVSYFVADPSGITVADIPEPVVELTQPDGSALTTFNADGTPAATLKGGFVYRMYLPDAGCLDRLTESESVTVYIMMTTTFGSTVKTAWDSIVIKNQQLFSLS